MKDQDTITITGGSGTDDFIISSGDTITLDLGGQGAALSTLTLDSMDSITFSSYTISGSAGGNGGGGGTGGIYTTSYNWSTMNSSSTVSINTDGIEMAPGTDIKVDGKSLKEFMTKMEQRLAILVPDPERLEKFEALKKAYEHYKTMEALCFPDEKDKENEC